MSDYETTLMNRWRQAGDGASQWALNQIEQKDKRIKELKRALSWLAGEVERDHELGRLSIDSEDCAKSARELLLKDVG